LNPDNGKLVWYYQHLPGDDWDEDFTHERTLLRTEIRPDRKFAKWLNPDIPPGEWHDVAVGVGEGGGIFVLDRGTGQFLWATPFPYDTPHFLLSHIDGRTGQTFINWDLVLKKPGERRTICYFNARSYYPLAYHPRLNSLYVPYADNCLDMTAAIPASDGQKAVRERREGIPRPGYDPAAFGGVAKVNMATGEIAHIYKGRAPGQSSIVATAGDLVFWGDMDQMFRAFDAENGKILWEYKLGGVVQNSVITYAIDGKQYVAALSGDGAFLTQGLINLAGINPTRGHNELYVFALPGQ
jgi:glucose dehydrogenase